MGETRTDSPRIIVAVCTFRRNEPLRRLLEAVRCNSDALGEAARVGVVVVDDNPDEQAREVCDGFRDVFALGLHYRTSGRGNISIARNIALETAIELGDWIAMTDDDCVPVDTWLSSYLEMQAATGADALTGPCVLQVSAEAPKWLREQPFLEDGQFRFEDGTPMVIAATNNSFFRASFFRERPRLRFEPELGVTGGEDMVFFRTASRAGLSIRFSARSIVRGIEPPERQNFRYQLRSRFWLGNSEYLTNEFLGEATRQRLFLRGSRMLAMAATRPLRRMLRGDGPQWRYALASTSRACGHLFGSLGIKLRHH